MGKKFIDLANLKSNLENFFSEIISPTFATKEAVTEQLGNHTVKSDVPENAVFTDTVYDDTEVQKRISDNGYGEVAGGKNLANPVNFIYNKVVNWKTGEIVDDNRYLISGYIKIKPNTVYTKTGFQGAGECFYYDKNKNPINNIYGIGNQEHIFRTPENAEFVILSALKTSENLQLEEGETATSYEPYFPSNKMLAKENSQQSAEMMDIKMLGWSVPRECPIQNEVNGNQFIQKVGRVDLGNLSWEYIQSFTAFRFSRLNEEYLNYGIKQHTKLYLYGFNYIGSLNSWASIKDADEKSIAGVWAGGDDDGFIIKSTIYTDTASFKQAMQGQYLYYELATPITTTIDGNEEVVKVAEDVDTLKKETTVNLLNPTLQTTTLNGVTCTNNGDGTYTVDGTATADVNFTLADLTLTGTYKILGAPKSENANKFYVGGLSVYYAPYSGIVSTYDNTTIQYDIAVTSGTTVNKELVKPMITTNLDATYDDFVPYTGDTGKLNSDVASLKNDLNSYALKSLYGDTTINVGRFASSAVGNHSTAEGYNTVASGDSSHAEGYQTTAGGVSAHAEGDTTKASGYCSHAEGGTTKASGSASHAEGSNTIASGNDSHAEGHTTTASNYASHASGKYNTAMTTGGASGNTTGTAFVIGNGTSTSALSNAFSVQYDGTVKAKSTITASTTADYAEFFEWLDKNPNEEDRVGHFVTLDGDKIKIATSEDDYILGIVSGEPFVLGNGDCDTWNGMYLHDEFRRTMYEPAPKMIEILDSEGNPTGEYEEVEGEYEGTRPILNPDYDPTQKYISRFDRVEWSPVGMLGVLAVLHDGTAEVNGYVTVNDEGIATKCTRDTRNSYRVIKKVSDKVVEVIFK